jgi:hypothetical protein
LPESRAITEIIEQIKNKQDSSFTLITKQGLPVTK